MTTQGVGVATLAMLAYASGFTTLPVPRTGHPMSQGTSHMASRRMRMAAMEGEGGASMGTAASRRGPAKIMSGDGRTVVASSTLQSVGAPEEAEYGEDEEMAVPAKQERERPRFTLQDPESRARRLARRGEGNGKLGIIMSVGLVAAAGAGIFKGGQAYFEREEQLVTDFGTEMTGYTGNSQQMIKCLKDYKKKLFPSVHKYDALLVDWLAKFSDETFTLQNLLSFQQTVEACSIKPKKLMQLAVEALPVIGRKPMQQQKLYLYLQLTCGDDADARKPLVELYKAVADLIGGNRSFLAMQMVKSKENALADTIRKGRYKNLPKGWEILGLPEKTAKQILAQNGVGQSRASSAPAPAAKPSGPPPASRPEAPKAPERGEAPRNMARPDAPRNGARPDAPRNAARPDAPRNASPAPPQPQSKPQPKLKSKGMTPDGRLTPERIAAAKERARALAGEPSASTPASDDKPAAQPAAKSYECKACGYTLFVARGREWKFFGDDFKCPECGADKTQFKEDTPEEDEGPDLLA